ncbi:MAG TPA: MmgE/PrpD family protein [Candidatus Dormibacteraeota bacterium]|jgi:2-methylcitrate dehydratase|nr:MmgE/PrpD family protein [Candidatus Dormibacteraeota bacterium]
MTTTPGAAVDEMAALLADFTTGVSTALTAEAGWAARRVLLDTLAVALGGLRHPAAQAARRYAYRFPLAGGSRVWGTDVTTSPETAALANGVPVRAYDHNDLYVGRRSGGHPSDMVAAMVAAAEWADADGIGLLGALALGYEVALALMDTLAVGAGGWDYANLTAIAATCGIARLLRLDPERTREALAITVIPHAASDEIESGELNRRGDLTMWKRFNGADAMRQSVYACLLAAAGAEGAVRPFTGRLGFLDRMGIAGDPLPELRGLLDPARPLRRIGETTFKRWPVGSRGQSAIQAALAARAQVTDLRSIQAVRVFTDEAAYHHLVRIRTDPWHPISRETADHSLPYLVAAAVLEGRLHIDSFALARVRDPERRRFLEERITVEPRPQLSWGAAGGFPTRVEIETVEGRVVVGEALPPPGHPGNPFRDRDLEAKLHENADAVLGKPGVEALIAAVQGLGSGDVRSLTALLRAGTEIDGAPAE